MDIHYSTPPTYSNEDSFFSHDEIKNKSSRRSKHIPHHLRPKHLVEQRNNRERRRVHDVNQAFQMLQTLLPLETTSTVYDDQGRAWLIHQPNPSRISKVQTLRTAVDYIEALQQMLNEYH